MKLITIQVSDEEHKDIKLKATAAGRTIKDYLLGDRTQTLLKQAALDKTDVLHTRLNPYIKASRKVGKPCKHGVDPTLCKFAKPGKPCK